MSFWRERALFLVALLIVMRFVAGAVLPLSADEAYYWLWSQHLSAGYYDHPPAIAYVIRAGTLVFGDTAFGVRVGGLVLSIVATWFVWRSAILLLNSEKAAGLAALFFNATLMIAVETMAATPDAPSVAMAAAFFFCLAQIQAGAHARWWIAAGAAAGLGLLSKYAALFLGAGVLFWLLAVPSERRWLLSSYPYLGGVLAALIFAPNVWWNATHDWQTFVFQFGRISSGGFTLKYLAEFIGAQLLLATPFIFVLGILGLGAGRRSNIFLAAALCWPSILYFFWHTSHDRVQGNWPCFLFPAFAVLAAWAWHHDWQGWRARVARLSRAVALPVALVLLIAAYAQALFTVIPLGRADPLARLLATEIDAVTRVIDIARQRHDTAAIITTDYASTGWLRFYMPGQVVIAATEDFRWDNTAAPTPALLQRPLLYVAEDRRDWHQALTPFFSDIQLVFEAGRPGRRDGAAVALYRIYRVSGWRGQTIGRLP